ncbi:MAG: replication-associated recombination protein A [Bacteroidales bacterium]
MAVNQPLADRMRPKTLEEFVGQEHLVGKDTILSNTIESGNIPSFILWGPPGTGKTTLAKIIAKQHNRVFFTLSAVHSGVKTVRETIEKAKKQRFFDAPNPILFIDEIHRFSKSQQDSLLSAVEQGIITLIGATTENPSFEVIAPLLSRCQVYLLKSLSKEELEILLNNALNKDLYLKKINIQIKEKAELFRFSGGDARKLYNILEILVNVLSSEDKENKDSIVIDNKTVQQILQKNIAFYDKNAEQHYDIISAFIKSIRGSDPNAAVYWLARMVEGGEDPKFIARRLVILASEDIGLANPNALLIANSCFDAVERIGWPESRIILSETAIYLATSPKSNSAYQAINNAQKLVKETGDLPVPLNIRNAPTQLMKDLGYGKDYKYAHDYPENFAEQEFLPIEIANTCVYKPQNNKKETEINERLKIWWKNKYKY